jgi:hypothetical protein
MSRASRPCRTIAECLRHDGERIDVVGVYTVVDVSPVRKQDLEARVVRLTLEGEPGPFLEPYWSARAARSPEEISRFQGRSVRVRGTFHGVQPAPPDARASTFGGSCLENVESLESSG